MTDDAPAIPHRRIPIVATEEGVDMGHTSDGRGIRPLRPEIVPGKSEAEIAAEFRDEAVARLAPVVDLINEARQKGMQINFQIGPPDGFNRQSLVMLEITKKLC